MKLDRLLIDWADEFMQDLVVSFTSRRPTTALRVVVGALYLDAGIHLVWAAILPFFRQYIEQLIGAGSAAIPQSQLSAFATNIIIGRISFHLLFFVAYFLLSFIVRASRSWTRPTATLVLLLDFVASLVALEAPRASAVVTALPWSTVILSAAIAAVLWLAPATAASPVPATMRRSFNERA